MINVNSNQKFFGGMAENIVGKGENARKQRFLLFPQCFRKGLFFQGRQKSGFVL